MNTKLGGEVNRFLIVCAFMVALGITSGGCATGVSENEYDRSHGEYDAL